MAPHTGLYPETEAFQPVPNLQTEAELPGIDRDSDGGGGTQKLSDLSEGHLKRLKRMPSSNQADHMLPASNAGADRRHTEKSTAAEQQVDFGAVVAGGDDAMKIGHASKFDHRADDLLTCGVTGWLKHWNVLDNGAVSGDLQLKGVFLAWICVGCRCRAWFAADVELKNVGCCDESFRPVAVLKERIANGFRAIYKQAAVEAVLFLGNPVSATVLADKDERRGTRGRFSLLHDRSPGYEHLYAIQRLGRLDHIASVGPPTYEFEIETAVIS